MNFMMKVALCSFFAALLIVFVSGCPAESKSEKNDDNLINLEKLNSGEYKIGVPDGTSAMSLVEKKYPNAKISYFNSLSDGYAAVEYNKIDAFAFDRHAMEYIVKTNPKLALVDESIGNEIIVVGAPKKQVELIAKVNKYIAQYRKDGTYKDMYNRWLKGNDLNFPQLPKVENPTSKIKVGTEGLNLPLNFVDKNGELSGYDVEFAKRLGFFLNADIEISTMTYPALVTAIETEKIDLIIANLNATPERGEKVLFSDQYVDSDITFIVRKDRLPVKKQAPYDIQFYNKKRCAVQDASALPIYVDKKLKDIKYLYYKSVNEIVNSLLQNKADFICLDEPAAYVISKKFPKIKIIPEYVADDQYGIALEKNSPLKKDMDKVMKKLHDNSTLKKLKDYWCAKDEPQKLSDFTFPSNYDGSAGHLKVGIAPYNPPMVYMIKNNAMAGFEVDVVRRIAAELNMSYEFILMEFDSLVPGLISGKINCAIASLSITPERLKSIDFVDTHYKGGIVLLVKEVEKANNSKWKDFNDLVSNGQAGTMTGAYGEMIIAEKFKNKNINSFEGFPDAVPALLNKKIDFIIGSHTSLVAFTKTFDKLVVLPNDMTKDGNAVATQKSNKELMAKIDKAIAELREDGTLDDLEKRWMTDSDFTHKKIEFASDAPVLKVAIAANREPVCFVQDGLYVGYDCELIERIAQKIGMKVEYQNMQFSSLIPAIVSGKADIAISNITKTKERAKVVLFSEVYFNNPQRLLVHVDTQNELYPDLAKGKKEETITFWGKFKTSFYRTFVSESRYKLVLDGLVVTIIIAISSALFGTILGFIVCMLRRSNNFLINIPAKVFIRVMQGMPMVVVLMILYYIVFGSIDINAVIVAIIGFSLSFAAYTSEMMRTGIEAVDKGQIEAAQAMGFGRVGIFLKIVFPQAARHTLPVYKGEFISMLKMTSVVGYIAIQDLTKTSDIIRSRTYEAFFPLIATAIIYFVLAYVLTLVLTYVEWKIDPKCRKRIVKGVSSK